MGVWNFTPTGSPRQSHYRGQRDRCGRQHRHGLPHLHPRDQHGHGALQPDPRHRERQREQRDLSRAVDRITSDYVYSDVAATGDAGNTTYIQSINAAGQALGSYQDSSGVQHGFIYDSSSGMSIDVPTPDGRKTNVQSITDAGQVLGTYCDDNNGLIPFVYDSRAGAFIPVNDPSFPGATIQNINSSDEILGFYFDVSGQHAFFYHSASKTYTPINDPLPADVSGSLGQALNDAGQVLGSYRDGGNTAHAFVYDPSSQSYTDITDPAAAPGDSTYAQSINNSGQVLAYYVDASSVVHSFIYDTATGAVTDIVDNAGVNWDRLPRACTMPGRSSATTGMQISNSTGSSTTVAPAPTPISMILRR